MDHFDEFEFFIGFNRQGRIRNIFGVTSQNSIIDDMIKGITDRAITDVIIPQLASGELAEAVLFGPKIGVNENPIPMTSIDVVLRDSHYEEDHAARALYFGIFDGIINHNSILNQPALWYKSIDQSEHLNFDIKIDANGKIDCRSAKEVNPENWGIKVINRNFIQRWFSNAKSINNEFINSDEEKR